MDEEMNAEMERDAASDMGLTYLEYVSGVKKREHTFTGCECAACVEPLTEEMFIKTYVEEPIDELSEVMGPFNFVCPCPDCNPECF